MTTIYKAHRSASPEFINLINEVNNTTNTIKQRAKIEQDALKVLGKKGATDQISLQLCYHKEIELNTNAKQTFNRRMARHTATVWAGYYLAQKGVVAQVLPIPSGYKVKADTGKLVATEPSTPTTTEPSTPAPPAQEEVRDEMAEKRIEALEDSNKQLIEKAQNHTLEIEKAKKDARVEVGQVKSELEKALDMIEALTLESATNLEMFNDLKARVLDTKISRTKLIDSLQ